MEEDMMLATVRWSHLSACWQVRRGYVVLGDGYRTRAVAELAARRWEETR